MGCGIREEKPPRWVQTVLRASRVPEDAAVVVPEYALPLTSPPCLLCLLCSAVPALLCRGILQEGQVPPRTGYIIQNLMAVRKAKFASS